MITINIIISFSAAAVNTQSLAQKPAKGGRPTIAKAPNAKKKETIGSCFAIPFNALISLPGVS